MATSRLTTLGGFALDVNGNPTRGPSTRKSRALMAYLIMNRATDAARDRLIEIFWPDAEPEHARDSLKTALWSIRRCLRLAGIEPEDYVFATKSVMRWTAPTTVDALEFAQLAAREDLAASRAALQLYRGDFLEGDYDEWAATERERLASLFETVLARVVKTSKDAEAAQRFIKRNPYDEDAYTTLIEAELAAGRRASAAAWVERCRKALSEVGEKPSAAFEAQFGKIIHVELPTPDELTLPFAGRESELAFLTSRFAEAKHGRGSVTLVHGEAGIGKTSLLNRAAQAATQNGLRAVVIRCSSEVPSTFGPWPGAFSAIGAGDFDAFVRTCTSDLANALARAIAARLPGPTAIIVDDAHELTAEALDILVAFAQIASKYVLILGLRPEGSSLLRSRLSESPFEELPVARLDRDSLRWALAQALGHDQPELLDALYQRTGGHPLFFAGLLNSLVAAGALARSQDRWQLTKSFDSDIELPDTVRHFIEARLQARGTAPRTVACALALEPASSADDLIVVLRMDESSLLDALDDLLALGLITQPASGAQFAFSHDLIREVAAAGLNVGRRTTLHRAFAQRLRSSGELEVSLRLARHLAAAGDSLSSAQSYLKSALEALELNAAQDAIDRCNAGIQAAEKLERTASRDVLLAKLQSTAARAANALGDMDEALERARQAVSSARAAGDLHESAQAMIALAVTEGAAFHVAEQESDAEEAVRNAKLCGDAALEVQALVLQGSAARELGLRDHALQAGQLGADLALESGDPAHVAAALEELLRTQVTWWLIDDALRTARTGLDAARRAGPLAEAAFLEARSALYYLVDRFDDAQSDLQAAMRITSEGIPRRQESNTVLIRSLPLLQFAGRYMTGKVAVAQRRFDEALAAAESASALTTVAKVPHRNDALSLLRIDALLQRNLPGDGELAHELAAALGGSASAQGTLGWSCCVELARARDAARMRAPGAAALVRQALNVLEENANRAPLDADRAFARLAEAAEEAVEAAVADRARGRSKYYRSRRLAAAGAEWGGEARA